MAASTQARRYALPAAGNTSEQARVFLQERIRFLAGLVGLICLGFLIAKPAIELLFFTGRQSFSYVSSRSFIFHVLGTAVALGNWALLRAKQLDTRALHIYFAMEYLQGLGLDDLVRAIGPLPPERVVHLLDQICGSLIEAHAMGLIHRDIKPANVIVCEQGGVPDVVKVLDFGLVKDTRNPHEGELTASASFLGTPLYASPEAVKGGEITAASDMYAVAAVGYTLLTGTDVFGGPTVMEISAGHLYKEVESPSSRLGKTLPQALELLIVQGLAKDPAGRPADARAFRRALSACGVNPWPEEDAVAWWQSVGRELVRRRVVKADAPANTALAVTLVGRQD